MRKKNLLLFILLVGLSQFCNAQSSPQYIKGTDTLVVYRSIPNLPEFMPKVEASEKQDIRTFSDKFTIRVRSAASNNVWVDVLALYTYNRAVEILDLPQTNGTNSSTSVQNYPNATAGWSHSYGNIEMSKNQPVEVEISLKPGVKIDGKDIYKATVHPAQKASAAVVVGGKVYFTLRNPAQVAIDINGQMDDHNPFNGSPVAPPNDGVSTYTVPIHTVTLFANPVIKKPALNDARTFYVVNGQMPTVSSTTYDILYFMPGVHNIGLNNKIYPGKSIYIPGDAIIFGSLNNAGVPIPAGFTKIGERIKIFGYGTISGARTKHPSYDVNGGIHEPVNIENALNYQVSGITITDPAHFSLWTPGGGGGLVTYVKVIGWRANGDGLGNGDNVNDCFVRTNDDESYVRGNRKRVTYWKDNISAIFYMAQIWTAPVLIEDCDILYCRARGGGGAAWDMRADQSPGVKSTQATFRNIRFHDPKANMVIFNLVTYKGSAAAPTEIGQSYNWIKFENISIKSSAVKSNLMECAASLWDNGSLTFDNVSYAGTTLSQANFATYFNTNVDLNKMRFGTPVYYTLTLNVSGGGGTVTGGGTFNPSNTATIAAKSASGYIFDKWTEGATIISSDSIYSFNVLASRTLTANFIPFSGATYTIAASASNSSSGTITGDGVYREGQLISVSATANSCNTFVNWTENSAVVSTDANFSFKVVGNRNLIANFSPKSFTVNNVTPEGGTVTGDLTYSCNQIINVTAAPNINFKFDGWYANDTLISTNLIANLNTGNARQIKAKFLPTNIIPELTAWVSGTTNNKVAGNNRLMVVMVMGEDLSIDINVANINYGGQAMTKITDKLFYETTYRTYASIFILKENEVNAASSGAIDVTWNSIPSVGYSVYSVLLSGVDQTTPVSASANNSLAGTTITTADLAAGSGDLILMCGATAGNNIATTNNGFTKQFETNAVWGDGVGGSKLGTGVNEIPSFTQSASGRMVLCAMVVKKSAATTGIKDIANVKFNIYPNPASDILFFNSAEKMVGKIQLLDLTGKIVYSANVQLNNGSVDLKGIAKGMYLVKIVADNNTFTKKISIR